MLAYYGTCVPAGARHGAVQEDNIVDDAVAARPRGAGVRGVAVVATRLQHHLQHHSVLLTSYIYSLTHASTCLLASFIHAFTHSTYSWLLTTYRPTDRPIYSRLHLPQREARLASEAAHVEQLSVVRAREHLGSTGIGGRWWPG